MQQLILLLTSFLLGCGFPVFLIGFYSVQIWESRLRSYSFYSVQIWESRLRSYSLSFADSDSSVSGRDKAKSKHMKFRRDRSKDWHNKTGGDSLGREKSQSPTFSSSKRGDQVYPAAHIYFGMCCPLAGRPLVCLWREVHPPPPTTSMPSPRWAKGGPIPQHLSQTLVRPLCPFQTLLLRLVRVWRC
jgi:hypothetical protein